MNYEAWNRCVLAAIGLSSLVLYCGLLYAGLTEFKARISKNKGNRKRSRNRATARRLRDTKVSGH